MTFYKTLFKSIHSILHNNYHPSLANHLIDVMYLLVLEKCRSLLETRDHLKLYIYISHKNFRCKKILTFGCCVSTHLFVLKYLRSTFCSVIHRIRFIIGDEKLFKNLYIPVIRISDVTKQSFLVAMFHRSGLIHSCFLRDGIVRIKHQEKDFPKG